MKSAVLGSSADGTVRTYLGGFRRWKRWASCNHVCLFPANPFQVAIYLQCLLQDAKSPSPVLNAGFPNESSRTDQFRDGKWIVIARSDLPTCPVKALEEFISAAQIDLSGNLPLFRALATWSKEMVRSQGISYTSAYELVKDALRGLTDVSKLSLHSLGAGGATSSANAGIPDRLFKRHGRWVSENAKDGYVKDYFDSRLLVKRSLGI